MPDLKTEGHVSPSEESSSKPNARSKIREGSSAKRKCVSTACIACRRRKSKCDGNLPSCAACASVYGTDCVYDPNSDHRRKGVYKKGVDSSRTQDATLRVIIEGILNYTEEDALDLVKQIRACESLEDVARSIRARDKQEEDIEEEQSSPVISESTSQTNQRFEKELSGKLGGLRLENGSIQFVGGTSNLLYDDYDLSGELSETDEGLYVSQEAAIRSWTTTTQDTSLILHLLRMYFTWHYSYFTTLPRSLFFRDFLKGRPATMPANKTLYCTPLLVNAMLALGCHFTSWPAARADPENSATAGDHFFKECKAIIVDNDEYEHTHITTVQALALMSVREAGCGREAKGWIYSGMSFRMAVDLGLPYESSNINLSDEEADARRITFWGCYLFDKCWSNYLGRPPQLALDNITVEKFDVFPQEDADFWAPFTDSGLSQVNAQPSRTRAVALHISTLCEISSDLLLSFYSPNQLEKPLGKQAELKKLSDLHTRLEGWKSSLPKELEPKEGQLPQVLIMHMFFYLLFIHLFRPFLKYTHNNTPLPAHVSPRRHCTQAAAAISKLLRLYKKTHGLRQICNIVVYIAHSACTIHLLNLQDKDSRRDLAHGLRHLEEIAECWLCARRTLNILQQQIRKWEIDLPEESQETLARADAKFQFSKLKPDGRSEGGSPGVDLFSQISVPDPQQFQFSPVENDSNTASSGISSHVQAQQVQGHATGRIRSSSAARRAELLLQMQQNSLHAQSNLGSFTSFPTSNAPQRPTWNENVWKLNGASPINSSASSGGISSHKPQIPTSNSANRPVSLTMASPTTMMSPQQGGSIFEEQRDWWLRDQSTLFDNWTRRDSMGGNLTSSPLAGTTGINGHSNLLGTDVYSEIADAQLTGTQSGFAMVSEGTGPMSGWENLGIQSFGQEGPQGRVRGDNGYGGHNSRMC